MAAVSEIKEIHAGQQTSFAKKSNNSKLFDAELVLGQADALLKNTGQYIRWQQLRQNNDREALWVGKRLLERHELVAKWQNGQLVDGNTFDQLTSQLKVAGIHLYTLKQLQQPASSLPASPPRSEVEPLIKKSQLPPSQQLTPPARVSVTYPVVSSASQPVHLQPYPLSPSEPVTLVSPSTPTSNVADPAAMVQPRKISQRSVSTAPTVEKTIKQPATAAQLSKVSNPFAPTVGSVHPAVSSSILDEENLLILDLRCPQIGLQDTIFGYADEHTVMLPLSKMMQGLDFNVSVDTGKGTANGWFISEERLFRLDVNNQQVIINGNSVSLASGSVITAEDDIYVSAKNMASWFPLDFDISRSELTATLTPREQLPQQARLEREKRRFGISSTDIPLKYPVRPLEYDLFSIPVVNVDLSGGVGTNDLENSYLNGRYSILAQGDLAYMSSYIFLSGYEDSPASTARIRLERVEPDANLLGPLHATRAAVGDILPATFPILTNVSPERGVFLSNEDLLHSIDYDSTRFEGNLQPGWQVELYRNGALLHGVIVGGDGRYLFDEVPLYFGKNDFIVKAYGPQGQQKTLQEKSFRIGSRMLSPGDSLYQMSASQRDTTILGFDEQNSGEKDNSGRFTGRFKYGLTQNLSLGTGLSSVVFGDERHNYLQAGISGNASFFYGEADYLYDTATGGSGLSLLGQTAVGPLNIKGKYDFFNDFVMESRPESTLEWKARMDVDGNVEATALTPSISYTFSAENTQYTDSNTGSFSNRLATRLRDIYLSNYITLQYGNSENIPFDGQLQASGNIGPVRVAGSMKYKIGDENKITRYGISSQWQVGENLRTGLDLIQDTDYYNRTTVSAKLDWDAGFAMVSPRVSIDSDGKFGSFLTLSFSFGKAPEAEWDISSSPAATRGNISTLVYHDQNNNKLFDEGDTPLADVAVQAVQARKSALTDDNGHSLVSSLRPYMPTDVKVDEDSLEDPFWIPSTEGVAVLPRPGHYERVEIPIVTGGEVDGTISFTDDKGVRQLLSNVLLEIVTPEGEVAKNIRSEYDGFYLFERVLPGTYTVRVSPRDELHASLAAGIEIPITIGNDGTIVSGTDINLQQPEVIALQDIRSEESEVLVAGTAEALSTPEPPADIDSSSAVAEQTSEPVRLWPDPIDFQLTPTDVVDGTISLQQPEEMSPQDIRSEESEVFVAGTAGASSTPEPPVGIDSSTAVAEQASEPVRLWPDPIDFQLTPTGVIDGTIYAYAPDGERRVLAEVNLEVVDEQGALVKTVRSGANGSYQFDDLLPGTYTLQVSPEEQRYAVLDSAVKKTFLIGNDTTIVRDADLVFSEPGKISNPLIAESADSGAEMMPIGLIASQPINLVESETVVAGNTAREEASGKSDGQVEVAMLPVEEYTFAARQRLNQASVAGRSGRSETATMRFSVMPQPIAPFTPIELASVEPVRRVNPYGEQVVNKRENPLLPDSSSRQGTGNGSGLNRFKIVG